MAVILSLDSSTSVCSVAVHRDNQLVINELNSKPRAAASSLAVMVQSALVASSISREEISAVAITSGPGSYTGLRITTSTAKGLCMALNVPLISVDSISVLAKQVVDVISVDFYCPMIDARRMEVYYALLNKKLHFMEPISEMEISPSSFQDELQNSKIALFGDGSEKFKKMVNHKNAIFVEGIQPNAKDLGKLAYERFQNGKFESLDQFEPFYLKDFYFKKK